MGAQLGDDVVYAEPGDLVFKPRDQWHTFWNAGDTTCRLLEIISPAGFEHFFNELGEQMAEAKAASVAEVPGLPELGDRYGIYFHPESVPQLCQQHGLVFPGKCAARPHPEQMPHLIPSRARDLRSKL